MSSLEPSDSAPGQASLGLLVVLLTALISGVSTFVNVYAVHGTSSDPFVTVRNCVVVLLLLPVALLGGRAVRQPLTSRQWTQLLLIGVIGGGIPFLLFFHGLALASTGGGAVTAAFLYRTLFLMATIFGFVFLKERFHGRVLLAAALLLVGNVLLLSLTSPVWSVGSTYVLAATVLWAVEYTVSKHALRQLPSSTVGLGRMGFGAVFLLGYLAATAQLGGVSSLSPAQWEWVGVSAVLLAAFVATWYAGLGSTELGVATSVLVLGFPVTLLLGALFHSTPLTLAQAAGLAAIVTGAAAMVGLSGLRGVWGFLRSSTRRLPAT
jgi:drug/metabolite transporter (DMT)-like permease